MTDCGSYVCEDNGEHMASRRCTSLQRSSRTSERIRIQTLRGVTSRMPATLEEILPTKFREYTRLNIGISCED